jgi:hypothetical protein
MRHFLLAGLAGLLAGCAGNPFQGYNVAPGTPRDAVLAQMGQPTRVVRLANGERLQYSRQPYGREMWIVDLDAGGRAVQAGQMLTEANFNQIQPGRWTRDDVERDFGPPAWTDRVTSWHGTVMTYRWRDPVNTNMLYFVYLDPANVVQRAHPGIEFLNAPNERR